jgi:hypothetical protein
MSLHWDFTAVVLILIQDLLIRLKSSVLDSLLIKSFEFFVDDTNSHAVFSTVISVLTERKCCEEGPIPH